MLKKSDYVSITEYKTSGEYRITIYGKQQTIRELALSEVYANKESEYARSILDILARDFTQYDTQEYPLTTVREYKRKDPITTKKLGQSIALCSVCRAICLMTFVTLLISAQH